MDFKGWTIILVIIGLILITLGIGMYNYPAGYKTKIVVVEILLGFFCLYLSLIISQLEAK